MAPLSRYAIGLSWHVAGFTVNDLPPHPGWDWGLDYDTNAATGHVPAPALLQAARFSSTLFLALSVVVMFALGWRFGGRLLAYVVSALYAVNPIVLLNGRRAMQEGSMLFFGLLAILIAVAIGNRLDQSHRGGSETRPYMPLLFHWLALIVAGGLTLASKHSGIVFVVSALGWIFAAELIHLRWRALLLTASKLVIAAALMVALFVALSPALWNNPPARLLNLLEARAELLDIQVASEPLAPTTLAQRVEGIVTEPFLMPPQHFEVTFWGDFPTVVSDIERY
ncbi:MAG: phospholipid carrier-dependent glycosyltransferase, partial [Anaerolineae bacterium]|nr:phospholipid carrier-dependent glycosyltransferase [Anaerolineae bacterium]